MTTQNIDNSKEFYGNIKLGKHINRKLLDLSEIVPTMRGSKVWVRGRLSKSTTTTEKSVFSLRQRFNSIQAKATRSETISKQMLDFISSVTPESVVEIEGYLNQSSENDISLELDVTQFFVVSSATPNLPFTLEDAMKKENKVDLDIRLDNRVIDLRTQANQAIFSIKSGIAKLFRDTLDAENFIEIQVPKFINVASEGCANVFKVNYFDKEAYLAQSQQLYKQLAIAADFNRVYAIGTVFRAEYSKTHRHQTEYTAMDIEMAFNYHYHEVLHFIGNLFVSIFKGLEKRFVREIEIVRSQYPSEPFKFVEPSFCLDYIEGVKLLNEHGIKMGDQEDISMENEKILGKIIKEKYGTDFFILDKYPLAIRPFYTMPDPNNPKFSHAFDMFIRGQEVLSGSERIYNPSILKEKHRFHETDVKKPQFHKIEEEKIDSYINSFKYGCFPHAGGCIGLERIAYLYLGLDDVRGVTMFPRDQDRLIP